MARMIDAAVAESGMETRSSLADRDQIVVSRAGYEVDTSGKLWRIPHPGRSATLDWLEVDLPVGTVLHATEAYFSYLIRNYSVREVSNNWEIFKILWPLPSIQAALEFDGEIPFQFLGELANTLSEHEQYRLHYGRKWYCWCSDQGFAPFSPEVAFLLDERVIGGNEKGHAVRSADPDKGPLLDSEVIALSNALRASPTNGTLTLQEQAAIWLALALGSNPEPLALLREEDFWDIPMTENGAPVFLLEVPRHKKGHAAPRAESVDRRLNPEIGEVLLALFNQNRADHPMDLSDSDGRPLFRRQTPRKDLPQEGPGSDYRYHRSAHEFSLMVTRAVEKLSVISPRTGRPLRVTMRRLRYTFATRLVREGASRQVVARLLDHTDLQNVSVYFDVKSDIVEALDAAMALTLGPLSQAFLGTLVRNEQEAIRGERPSSRVYHTDRKQNSLEALGTCGSFSFCGLTAPIACYTCVRFQPWMDAPHDKALSGLLDERKRREEIGLGPSMIMLFDTTILAIADVIMRIDIVQAGGSSAG